MRKGISTQRGYILPLSIVVMMFGTMVVGSMLTYVNASLNSMRIGRDNVNAYHAADAGIQVIIAKLVQADYKENDSGEPDELGHPAPLPDRAYPTDDEDLRIDVDDILEGQINGYEVRVTVEYLDMSVPDYVEYKITSYACVPGSSGFDEAKDKVIAIVRQEPYPASEAWTYSVSFISYQRQ